MNPADHRCPDDEAFAELFDGVLTPDQREAFHGRLVGCAACQETLAVLGLVLADEPGPAPAGLVERLTARVLPRPRRPAVVARLVDGVVRALREAGDAALEALSPAPRPALLTRGGDGGGDLRYEVDLGGAPVELVLAVVGDRATLTARPLHDPPPRARLVLLRSGEMRASMALEADGVTVNALDPGHYVLRLEVPGQHPAEIALRLER